MPPITCPPTGPLRRIPPRPRIPAPIRGGRNRSPPAPFAAANGHRAPRKSPRAESPQLGTITPAPDRAPAALLPAPCPSRALRGRGITESPAARAESRISPRPVEPCAIHRRTPSGTRAIQPPRAPQPRSPLRQRDPALDRSPGTERPVGPRSRGESAACLRFPAAPEAGDPRAGTRSRTPGPTR